MKQKIKTIMSDLFEIPLDEINDQASSETIAQWDSINHMALVLSIEEAFDIAFDEQQIAQILSIQAIETAVRELTS